MKPRFLIAAAAVACATQASPVCAQVMSGTPGFEMDPRVGEGLGIKTGDFELHPGVAAEAGYDSNYFQRSGTGNETPIIDAYRLRITPSLSFRTMGQRTNAEGGGPPPVLALNGALSASYNALFAADSHYSSEVSNQDHVAATAALGLDILPDRPWGGDISADFARTVEASNDPDTADAFRRDTVNARAGILWRPGGGLFRWRLGYALRTQFFEDSGFSDLNNLQHRLETQGRWKFLPRTALVYSGELDWLTYTKNPQVLSDGSYARSLIGVNGLISNYFGALIMGGWGETFFKQRGVVPAENFDSFIGQAELTWYPGSRSDLPEGTSPGVSSVSVGYHRTFAPSYLGNYYIRDRGYLNGVLLISEHFVLSGAGGFSHITRPLAYLTNGDPQQNSNGPENRIDATAFFEYRPTSSVGINATFRYDTELNTKPVALVDRGRDPTGPIPIGQADDLYFKRYQIFIGVRWFL